MMVLAFWEFCNAIFEPRIKSRRSAEAFGEKIVLIVPSTYDILYQSQIYFTTVCQNLCTILRVEKIM